MASKSPDDRGGKANAHRSRQASAQNRPLQSERERLEAAGPPKIPLIGIEISPETPAPESADISIRDENDQSNQVRRDPKSPCFGFACCMRRQSDAPLRQALGPPAAWLVGWAFTLVKENADFPHDIDDALGERIGGPPQAASRTARLQGSTEVTAMNCDDRKCRGHRPKASLE